MRQDIREMSYVFQKDKQDKDLIYVIDLVLYKIFEKEFDKELTQHFSPTYLDNIYFEILKDRDSIITYVIENNYNDSYFCGLFINDTEKLQYLIDNEFMKQLDKCKKYYDKRLKTRNKIREKELIDKLLNYFEYCYINCDSNCAKNILKSMSTSNFRQATINDLEINLNNYEDFNKIYNKALKDFKSIHNDDMEERDDGDGIGFGWKTYGVIKGVETLFKL